MRIEVAFTGICIIVRSSDDLQASVVVPNARLPVHLAHDSDSADPACCAPGHVPFLEVLRSVLPGQPGISPVPPILLKHGPNSDITVQEIRGTVSVVDMNNNPVVPIGSVKFVGTDIVDMSVVSPGSAVDLAIVSDFDPLSQRVAARIPITSGELKAVPPNKQNVLEFKNGDTVLLCQPCAQEVIWAIDINDGNYKVVQKAFGAPTARDLLLLTAGSPDPYRFTIGNAPFEDILLTGVGLGELLDHHFAIYYDYLKAKPTDICLPSRVSEFPKEARTGGADCPPAVIKRG